MAGLVDKLVVTNMVKEFPPLDTQDQIEIIFIQMYDSKAMDLGDAWILLEHGIDYDLPAGVGVAKRQSIVQQC